MGSALDVARELLHSVRIAGATRPEVPDLLLSAQISRPCSCCVAVDRAGSLLDDVDRCLFGRWVDLVVAELGLDIVAGFGVVVDQKEMLIIGSHAVRHLFAEPVVQRVLSQSEVRESMVSWRPDPFLGITG